jgi:uncharacterized protein
MRLSATFLFMCALTTAVSAQPFLNCDEPSTWSDGTVCRNAELQNLYFELQRDQAAAMAKSPAMQVSVVTDTFRTAMVDVGRCKNSTVPETCARDALTVGLERMRSFR